MFRLPRSVRTVVILGFVGSAPAVSQISQPAAQATVSADSTPVYSRMSTSSDIVKTLKKGDAVKVDFSISTPDTVWCSIVEPGRTDPTGYLPCRYLDRRKPPESVELASPSAPRGERVRFRFSPPVGAPFVQVQKVTKVKRSGDKTQTDVAESRVRVTISHSEQGYTIAYKVLSATATRDGRPVPTEMPKWLQNTVVTYEVNANGQLLGITGWEDTVDKLRRSLPPQAAEFMATLVSDQMLIDHAKAEWDARIGSFAGMEAAMGESWSGVNEVPLPGGGTAPMNFTTTLAGKEPCGTASCVRLEYTADSDSRAIGSMIERIFRQIAGMASLAAAPQVESAGIEVAGARLMDPDTMMIHSETTVRNIRLTVNVPGRGTESGELEETREYQNLYGR